MMIVSIAPDGFQIPNDRVECKNLRELYDVFTRDGEEEVINVPSLEEPVVKEAKKALELAFACEFRPDAPKKSAEFVTRVHRFMALDYDKGDPQQFARLLSTLRAEGGVGWYSTFRWSPAEPRVRFLLELDRDVTADDYLRCWDGLNALLEGALDSSTRSVSRGVFLWGRPSLREPGKRQLFDGPPASVAKLLEAASAKVFVPLATGDFDLGHNEGEGWKDVLAACKRAKKPSAKKALEFLEPALEGKAWGGKGNRNESMTLAMRYAAIIHGDKGIDVQRSVEFFAPALAMVKRADPSAGTTLQEMERALLTRIATQSKALEQRAAVEPFLSEQGAAERIAALNAGKLHFVHGGEKGRWFAWDGKRHTYERAGVYVHDAIVGFGRWLLAEADKLGDDGDSLRAFGTRLLSNSGSSAVELVMRKLKQLAASLSDFDSNNHHLFNASNGVVELATRKLLPHDPKYMFTKVAPVVFDPLAKSPLWDKFSLETACNDAAVVAYKQQIMGYCLSGDVSAQKFWLFLGKSGGNGKGVFVRTVMSMMGGFASISEPEMFLKSHGNQRHTTEILDLHGVRVTFSSELPEGSPWDLAKMKRLSGADRIKARRMGKDNEEFDPTAKMIVIANIAPPGDSSDAAFWRRMIRVEWDFQPTKADPKLEEKLRAELSGILNRALEGYAAWREKGFVEPDAVLRITRAYRNESDHIQDFLDTKCVIEPDAEVGKTDLWNAWVAYCTTNNLSRAETGSQNGFGRKLSTRFESGRNSALRKWRGLRLAGQVNKNTVGPN